MSLVGGGGGRVLAVHMYLSSLCHAVLSLVALSLFSSYVCVGVTICAKRARKQTFRLSEASEGQRQGRPWWRVFLAG